jgi:hypothetical protein
MHPACHAAATARDAFPHTRRPLPWLLAGFVAMVFFVPIASSELKLHLPVDSRIDRFAVIGLVLAWLWFGGDQRAFLHTRRSKLYVTAACVFAVVAVASLLLDAGRIINLGDFKLAEKGLSRLASYLILSWFALTALRFEDVRGFASCLIGFATLTAVGILVERRTGTNVFYNWTKALLGPIANVEAPQTNIHPAYGSEGRVWVVGPSNQPLAATEMLVLIMPLPLVRLLDATSRRSRWLNVGAFALIIAGALATDRKTALVVPVAVFIYIACYRPRQMLRLAPLGLVLLVGIVHLASPGALGTVLNFKEGASISSTTHREGDFTALAPDVLARPVLGRGYGTLDADKVSEFRINDDEYLDEVWQVGFVGLLAFVWMILAPVVIARRAIRTRPPPVASLALATSAGCVAFLFACPLFDALSFPEVPYLFFLMAALTTIVAAGPEGNVEPTREFVRRIARGRSAAVATT